MVNFEYSQSSKEFYINLTNATDENQKIDWMTVNNGNVSFNNDITNFNGDIEGAFHDLGNNLLVPKTRIQGPGDSVVAIGNFETGQLYVHDSNIISDIHSLLDSLKKASRLPSNNKSYSFGGIEYLSWDINSDTYSKPANNYSFTLSVIAMKKPSVVKHDSSIILTSQNPEVRFGSTDGLGKGILFDLDDGQQYLDENFEPKDKVLYNRLKLNGGENVYAPNIHVKAPLDKWIYIRNRSSGAIHNTFMSEIHNLHLYITSMYGSPSSGTGLGDLRYINLLDKVTKEALDFSTSQSNNIYTVSAEEQTPINDISREIIIEGDEDVVWAESNGLNDGTGYRYMDDDNNNLAFNKLDTRSVMVDGKQFFYPIISVKAPPGKTIRLKGAIGFVPNNEGIAIESTLEWETKLNFIDDLITYILNGDSNSQNGFKNIGFLALQNNKQYTFLADHFGNNTQFKVEASNAVAFDNSSANFLNIYDPLFFEPNYSSPVIDTEVLPFAPISNRISQAIFLLRDDYINNEGNLISGNLTNNALVSLLTKLLTKEAVYQTNSDKYIDMFGVFEKDYIDADGNVINSANDARPNPKNLVIIKEEFKGQILRQIRRLTDENSVIQHDNQTLGLHLNSVLHVLYEVNEVRFEMIIEIREDKDDNQYYFNSDGAIDQTLNISDSATLYNHKNHSRLVLKKNLKTLNTNTSNIVINLDSNFRPNPDGVSGNLPYVPVLRLDYEIQKELQLEFYSSGDSATVGVEGPTGNGDQFEKFKNYLEESKIHYLIDRDILNSYDTEQNFDPTAEKPFNDDVDADSALDKQNLEFGRNYVVLDMSDSVPGTEFYNEKWDFASDDGKFAKGYFKIELVPILNDVLKCYYQPGQRILKSNISDKVYYRDAIRGYVSLLNGDQYLNKSIHYFIEKDINYQIRDIVDGELKIRNEHRRYRLYLDFVEAPPTYNYNLDQKLYDNNIFITDFSLTELNKNKLFIKFSADNTKDDMYKVYLSENVLMKGISADGKVAITYQTLINEILFNMEYNFGLSTYDSEIYVGAIVQEETNTYNFDNPIVKRISIRPEFAQLQKIIISKDGSTKGADAVVINLTVFLDKDHPTPGQIVKQTVNKFFGTTGYHIKILQEEREGLKLYNLNRLENRLFLSFNSVYTLYLGLNDTKRVILRERKVNDIVEFNVSNSIESNKDQSIVVSKYDDLLRVPLMRKLDVINELGGDKVEIDPIQNLTLEAYYDNDENLVNNYLLTKEFIFSELGFTNLEYIFILNNNKFALDDGTYDPADSENENGNGLLKLTFTTIVNKILAVHYDDSNESTSLNINKITIQKRIYYKDSLLNDYVSLINDPESNFNKELEYFVEIEIDSVTYRLRLDFRPYPEIYSKTENKFDLGYMVKLDSNLSSAYDTNVSLQFSADNTNNDLHTVNINKALLLSNVDNEGNILISHTTVRNIIEDSMKKLYGKSWYDREMFLFGLIENGEYQLGDGSTNGILIRVSPFEYNFNKTLEIDLDLGTVTFVDQLPDEIWDFSVKSYGQFIAGHYQPNDFGTGTTSVKLFPKAFAQSAVLFDERNPYYNVKSVNLGNDVEGNEVVKDVVCGNVDPTSLVNLVNRIYIPDYTGKVPEANENGEATPIEPAYIFNPVTESKSETIYHTKKIAKGFNLNGQIVDLYSRDYTTDALPTGYSNEKVSDDQFKSAYLNPIVHKMLSGSLFTKFNNTVFVAYKDGMGLNKPVLANEYPDVAPNGGIMKRDLIMAKIISELEASEVSLFESKLFKLYNALGKYEMDLDKSLQLIKTNGVDLLPTIYDLEDFKINMLVKFKGTVSGNANVKEGEQPKYNQDEQNDNDPNVNSGASNNANILDNLVKKFFPESNAFVDDVVEASTDGFNARIRYETIVKFQFINKQVTLDVPDESKETSKVDLIGAINGNN